MKSINLVPPISILKEKYRSNELSPGDYLSGLLQLIRADDNNAWISVIDNEQLSSYVEELADKNIDDMPLYGVPFAVKDNIDLAGVPTTAACAEFSYVPEESAMVVQSLISAGAVPLGKTNLDQFATGLVGVRSPEPWGPCKNSLNPEMISGGSSSGSAVAVALGQVCFSLGTDTAGSGRVPAAFNKLIGVKPTKGLLSTKGVVPACASLDCVTIFAKNCDDANKVLDIAVQYDEADPWSRQNPYRNSKRYFKSLPNSFSFGVPLKGQQEFFGDDSAAEQFGNALEALKSIGGTPVDLDFSPLLDAAKLLYEGPWVAERYHALQALIESKPESILPVLQGILEPAKSKNSIETFDAQYRLQAYRREAEKLLEKVDVLVTPTAGTCYRIEEVLADPVQLNSNLGYYTNFMNLLDLAAIAVPTGTLNGGVGFGVTLFHNAFSDKWLLSLAARLEGEIALAPGASAKFEAVSYQEANAPYTRIPVVVCGAHLDGLPLNWQLLERGGQFKEKTRSAKGYKLYALAGGPLMRPGMVRDVDSDADIEIEIWDVPAEHFGSFVAEIPAPLGIGKVETADGRLLPGFICEASGLEGATEITEFGGWRNWLASLK